MLRRLSLLAVAAFLLLGTPAADAANIFEKGFWMTGPRYDAKLPTCDDPSALATIQARFGRKEGHFWNSDLKIVDFDHVREIAFRPWAVDTIPRRFCSGRAYISDGKRRQVNFSIIEDGGALGVSWGVEWCVVGLDRNWAYNPACKLARP
jgi:hypothetical protein